jgi:hypothetical protein
VRIIGADDSKWQSESDDNIEISGVVHVCRDYSVNMPSSVFILNQELGPEWDFKVAFEMIESNDYINRFGIANSEDFSPKFRRQLNHEKEKSHMRVNVLMKDMRRLLQAKYINK